MTKTFAVPDIHGQFDMLERALSMIETYGCGTVVFLGDYVDRGPRSQEVVERLMAGPREGWTWVCLKGNHEQVMTDAIANLRADQRWLTKLGGGKTLLSYGHPQQGKLDYSVVPTSHVEWLRTRPLIHEDAHRVFVHAKVDPERPIDRQDAETILWGKYDDADEAGHNGKHVVHGHHPHPRVRLKNRTALDAHAFGTLRVGVFDNDEPGGPVEVLTID